MYNQVALVAVETALSVDNTVTALNGSFVLLASEAAFWGRAITGSHIGSRVCEDVNYIIS